MRISGAVIELNAAPVVAATAGFDRVAGVTSGDVEPPLGPMVAGAATVCTSGGEVLGLVSSSPL